ncbi:MAG: hypothetical protein QY323_00175 [Patescibacteria group bacterium]|nr:MAG: hypothetical protein QY323_00175 [Patescibacteria group bacterium]
MRTSTFIHRSVASGIKTSTVALLAFALIAQIVVGAAVQAGNHQANPSADLDQCSNGPVSTPNDCTGSAWQNGNLNSNNSHYAEGQSAPYRVILENIPTTGTITLVIEYDIKHSGKHAIDYLTSFDRTESTASPCDNVSPCSLSGTAAFPAPSSTNSPTSGQPTTSFNALPASERALSMYNASISGTGITYVSEGDLTASSASTQVQIQFTASESTVVFAWGGHIGSSSDWGTGNSAGGISGSPYHMRLVSLTGANLGNQDRSLSADAVSAATQPGTLIVIKDVVNDDAGTSVASDFTMNVTGTNVSTSSFPGSDTGTSITMDAGSYSVVETAASGYTASYSTDCTGTIASGETKTCVVTNNDDAIAPTTGTITVEKVIVNDNGGDATLGDFQFFVYEAPGQVVDTSTSTSVHSGDANTFAPGTYWISEQGSNGYYTTTFSGACDGSPFVTLAAGEELTCTLTNDDAPAVLTVEKVVVGGSMTASDFPLFIGNTQVTSGAQNTVNAGSYVVSETNDPNQTNYTSVISGDCDPQGGITLENGDNKTCTITNTYDAPPAQTGTITVVKVVSGGTAQVSDFPLFIGQTSVTSSQAETLPVGSYVVSETNQANYTGVITGDCDAQGNVTLAADENLTCTITNTYVAPPEDEEPSTGVLTVVKVVINNDGGSAQVSDFPLFINQTSVVSGSANVLSEGSYVVSETGSPNYAASFSGDCDASGLVTISSGDYKTCTITNDDIAPTPPGGGGNSSAQLTVVTRVINDDGGIALPASFLMMVGDGISIVSTFAGMDTPGFTFAYAPGAYVVDSSVNPAYARSFSPGCTGTLAVNQSAICVVTHDDFPPSGGSPNPPSGGDPTPPPAPPSGGDPTPPPAPEPTAPVGPVPQVLGASDSDLPVTGMPAWTLWSVLLIAVPFLRRSRS